MGQEKMTYPAFGAIAPYQPRTYVPDGIDMDDAEALTNIYKDLFERPIHSADELERFVLDRSELDTALAEHEAILLIRTSCMTDDADRAERYKKFVENIQPHIKSWCDHLNRKYLQERSRYPLNQERYEVYDRNIKADVELFCAENIPLQTQEELLSQEYQTVYGGMMVEFQGQEHTLQQMSKLLEKTDRRVRKAAWESMTDRQLQTAEQVDEILDKMLSYRHQIAVNAGYKNYIEYKFREYHRFDYTPQNCRQFHTAIEQFAVPVLAEILDTKKKQMKLPALRPWDCSVDPLGREPLKPFDTIEQFSRYAQKVFNRIEPDFGRQFQEMIDLKLLDLESRKGKRQGGYQENLWEARKPFIFANSTGSDNDLRTLLHEGGHAFHSYASAHDPLLMYRFPPIEFCEVASMTMELFALPHRDIFYHEQDTKRSCYIQFEQILSVLVWIAVIDAFQEWLYEHPNHSRQQRVEAWVDIHNRFGGNLIDWSGLERQQQYRWQRQLHIFIVPLYYIEYGIAQLGALRLWSQHKKDKVGALNHYRKALSLGGSRPLPELFKAAGLTFDFSEKTIAPLMETIQQELRQLQTT